MKANRHIRPRPKALDAAINDIASGNDALPPPPPAETPIETYNYNPGLKRTLTHNYKWDLEDEARKSHGDVPTLATLDLGESDPGAPDLMRPPFSELRRKSQEAAYQQMQPQAFRRRISSARLRSGSRSRSYSGSTPGSRSRSASPDVLSISPAEKFRRSRLLSYGGEKCEGILMPASSDGVPTETAEPVSPPEVLSKPPWLKFRPGIQIFGHQSSSASQEALQDDSSTERPYPHRKTSFNFDDYKTNMYRKSIGHR
ncbi:unnamed protein product [Kuraishia capsulata CBS 1993]|uniref:Uncharacterized protein n=1 Tax=Kuraishia capsulata CBS 1993 TaxID=1382522 RepID=W6MKC0_9ASCO|nr:uncharacterized protein KUCA_T00002415001 [Kuraishia capsulata CBS 1993]CDK26443.1 unnamed protein product [Kuraishia capsulata CBS 1993]